MKIPSLTRFFTEAYRYLKNPKKIPRLIKSVTDYAKKNHLDVKGFFGDIALLVEMLKAWITGDYRKLPTQTILLIIIALLYFLSPVDLIPDYLPGGFLDDAAVIAWVIRSIGADITRFKTWKKRRGRRGFQEKRTAREKIIAS